MPLVARPRPGPPRPPPNALRPRPLRLIYIDPDGGSWNFSDLAANVIVTNVAGIGSPPVSMAALALPSGSILPQNYGGAGRAIVVGLLAYHDTQSDFNALQDRLTRALWTERADEPAPGTLIVQRPDGTARQIRVLCTDGPDLADEDRDKAGLTWMAFPATFRAISSYWEDATPISLEFRGQVTGGGVPPMPPVLLNPSTVLGSAAVNNTGDAKAYPVWTITGPGTPTLTNTTTGRSFGLDVELGEDDVVTINTSPDGDAYAIDQDDDDRWGDLVKASPRDLWALVPGLNQLSLSLVGADENSRIAMSYTRRWLRA